MKRYPVCLFAIACMIGLLASAADPLGAPRAGLGQGQFGVSVSYSYSELNLVYEYMGRSSAYDIDNMHTTYLNVGYGVTEWLEVFARLGAVKLESSDMAPIAPLSFDNDYDTDFIYGGGAKVTFGCVGNVTFGAVGTYSYADLDGDFTSNWSYFYGSVDMEMQQIQAAVGATWDVSERVAFYAGALMHHVRIDQDRARIGGYPNTDLMIKNDDGGSMFGGYIGTQIGLTDNLYFTIEGSYTGDSKGGSAILGWNF